MIEAFCLSIVPYLDVFGLGNKDTYLNSLGLEVASYWFGGEFGGMPVWWVSGACYSVVGVSSRGGYPS